MSREVLLMLLLLGATVSSALLLVFIYSSLMRVQISTKSRLSEIGTMGNQNEAEVWDGGETMPLGQRIVQSLGELSEKLPSGEGRKTRQRIKLLRAGIMMKPEELTGVTILASVIGGLLFLLLARTFIAALIGFFVGFILPGVVIGIITSRRSKKLNDQLPEALTVIANGIRAGFSFTQAVAMVVREMEDPIAEEFGKLLRENSLGKPMDEALESLSERTADEDLDIVITALLIQRQVGGSLAEILDVIAETIRERVRLKGDIRTMTAQGKMAAGIVSLMPFIMAIMLNLINPGYMTPMFTNPIGVVMLVVCAVMMILGIFVLTRIIKIKV